MNHRLLLIGAWRVDPALDEISREGTTIKIEPRAMRVLLCLAEHAGRVVSVDQLLETAWKDVVVTPDSVYQAVAGLRRALGDTSKEPTYIANVLRRGYRLLAPVTPCAETQNSTAGAPAPPNIRPILEPVASGSKHLRRWVWMISLLALTLVIAYLAHRSFRAAQITSTDPSSGAAVGIAQASNAVLPFVDMSDQKNQESFVDGLSEVLIDRLARVPGLHVPGRVSSFYFKDRQATVPEIAKALGVANLLEGTVRKTGDTLRITAQLVRADNGFQVWSASFDRPLSDAFKFQDEIADAVVQVLKISILNHYNPEFVETPNIEAYTLYFQTHAYVVGNSSADYDAAKEKLHAALSLDPQFAAAWGWLALVEVWKFEPTAWGSSVRSDPTPSACADAHAAAERALQLDPRLVQSHRAKGIVLQHCDGNLLAAEEEFKRALELQPGSSDALRSYAWLALSSGRLDQAVELVQRARALDPLNPWNSAASGDVAWTAGRLADAEAAYRKSVELGPTDSGLRALLADILLSMHKPDEALAEAQREPDAGWREVTLLFALDAAGRKHDADRAIAAYEKSHSGDDPAGIAAFYACRGDRQRTEEWLGQAHGQYRSDTQELPNRAACFKQIKPD